MNRANDAEIILIIVLAFALFFGFSSFGMIGMTRGAIGCGAGWGFLYPVLFLMIFILFIVFLVNNVQPIKKEE